MEANEEKAIAETLARLEAVNLADVLKVYSGRPGCACGCRGKYTYSVAHRELGCTDRGYPVDPEECDNRTVKLIYNKMLRALREKRCRVVCDGTSGLGNEGCFAIDLEKRVYSLFVVLK